MPKVHCSANTVQSLPSKLQSLHIPFKTADGKLLFSDGLRPLIHEISNGQIPLLPESASPLVPLSYYSGSNPILCKLSQQKRLLVNAPNQQVEPSLIGLLKEIPESMQVRVIVPDLNASEKLKDTLVKHGIHSFYVVHQNRRNWIPDASIRIAARSRLSSCEFDLSTADVVIFTDACMLIDSHSKGYIAKSNPKHDLSRLFDSTFPTRIPSSANVLAFLSDKPPLQDMRLLWSMLSIDTLQLDAAGSIIPDIYYRIVEFNHTNPPVFSSKHPSNFEVLKKAIWTNSERNRFITKLADDLADECKESHELCCKGSSEAEENAYYLSFLCTNLSQGNEVIKSYNGDKLLEWKVETSPLLQVRCVIPDLSPCTSGSIYIRMDAGIGMLDDLKPKASCLVIDIVDKGLPNLGRSAESRLRAYRHAGWVKEGKGIFLSRWNAQ